MNFDYSLYAYEIKGASDATRAFPPPAVNLCVNFSQIVLEDPHKYLEDKK